MLTVNQLRYGNLADLPERLPLRAGPLTLVYEQGDLRYVRLGDQEILRRLYVAVRDRNWGTIPAVLSDVRMEIEADAFRITYQAVHQQDEIDFRWQATLTGDATGTIGYAMEGQAHATFLKNRIGFCALHPIRECAGIPCQIEHPDGALEAGAFPEFISPHQPFVDIQAIRYEVMPNLSMEMRFEGDVFEMEDQRNWTDASFKTYGTPLHLPYPVAIEAGTSVSQRVTLKLQGSLPVTQVKDQPDPPALRIGEATGHTIPQIGLGLAFHGGSLTLQEQEALRTLSPSHLRVDLPLSQPEWPLTLQNAVAQATALNVALELALHLSDNAEHELQMVTAHLSTAKAPISAWLIFHSAEKVTSERWITLARKHLGAVSDAPLVSGTNAYFTEINREHPPVAVLDGLCFSVNPQVHAFDNSSLIETLEAIPTTIASARQFCGDLPIYLSPLTLKPRFNPDATGAARLPAPDELPSQVDPRQMSLFGAAWTLGSLKALSESGVSRATYYETTGWRGVMETEQVSSLPMAFPSLPASVFPLYHILADVNEFRGGTVRTLVSTEPLTLTGLTLEKEGRIRLLLANLTNEPQTITVQGVQGNLQVRRLDETNVEDAMRFPAVWRAQPGETLAAKNDEVRIQVLPYSTLKLDWQANR